jgi:hypothetical protein
MALVQQLSEPLALLMVVVVLVVVVQLRRVAREPPALSSFALVNR